MNAHAAASASVTINGRTVSQTGSGSNLFPLQLSESFYLYNVQLGVGQSADFTFDYILHLRDDGLPVEMPQGSLAASVFSCVPLIITTCGPRYTGFEVAKLDFDVAYRDGRALNRWIEARTDGPSHVTRQTGGDSFADMLTESGTVHVHVTNTSITPESDSFLVYSAVWVLAVPEPQTWALMLIGLATVVALGRFRCELPTWRTGLISSPPARDGSSYG
jgi:hypothetical protein